MNLIFQGSYTRLRSGGKYGKLLSLFSGHKENGKTQQIGNVAISGLDLPTLLITVFFIISIFFKNMGRKMHKKHQKVWENVCKIHHHILVATPLSVVLNIPQPGPAIEQMPI